MARYIDAEAFKRKLLDEKCFFPAIVSRALVEMPTADVVEVKHGEWIEDKTHISKRRKKYVCSNCLHYITIKTTTDINSRRYCYECGAKMKIKEN